MNADTTSIRPTSEDDLGGVMDLYPWAFPDEDLTGVVGKLWWQSQGVTMFVADNLFDLRGHIALTECRVGDAPNLVALLGPLAVHPNHHGQGLGTALVQVGLGELEAQGFSAVYVLGDPGYYSRLGFSQETAVAPPYALPDDWASAWQSRRLAEGDELSGTLQVPAAWQDTKLWSP